MTRYNPTDATNRIRQLVAALEKACTDALAYPGNPFHDERGVDLANAAFDVFECDDLHAFKNDLLHDLGMDEDCQPLLDVFGYRDGGLAA